MRDATIDGLRRILSERTQQVLRDPSLKPSAVLLLLYQRDGEYHMLFNKRSDRVEFHKGEVCFPGGGQDPGDGSLLATALRETQEEMGVAPEDVEPLGVLDHVATRSRFFIHPIVGLIPYPYPFKVSSEEIAEVLEVPLSALFDPATLREEVHLTPDGTRVAFSYAYHNRIIFGATARILTSFLELLAEALGKEAPWTTKSLASSM
ncbi:MAG: CoA pyrophosphatase [Chloroflexi bacterium]|nr:CoA pyrophosphatase [Chloroflexota bacterium]